MKKNSIDQRSILPGNIPIGNAFPGSAKLALAVLLTLFFNGFLFAQEGIKITQSAKEPGWLMQVETENHIEIFTKVIQCNPSDPSQVHVMVFNENPNPKRINFEMEVFNADNNKSFVIKKELSLAAAEVLTPDCSKGNKAIDNLKFDLPRDYNDTNIQITVLVKD